MPQRETFLLVDDDAPFRDRLGEALSDRGYQVLKAADTAAGKSLLSEHNPDYAVIDLRMPGESGLELVRFSQSQATPPKSVVLTGYGCVNSAVEAMRLGAINYLTKPASVDEILASCLVAGEEFEAEDLFDPDVPSLAQVEWEYIQRVLHDNDGNITKAARTLGIHRRSLQRKLARRNSDEQDH